MPDSAGRGDPRDGAGTSPGKPGPTWLEVRLRHSVEGCGILAGMERTAAAARDLESERIARAREGDRRAFEELVRLHIQRVWRIVWRILRHEEDTEDVVQEVFMAAHKALPVYRGESSFSTWLHRIAVNRALNHRARGAERIRRASLPLDAGTGEEEEPEALQPPSNSPSPLEVLEARELSRRLAACLEELPPAWRAVFVLRVNEDLSYEAIASVMDLAIGTVRSRLSRARLALRRCIAEEPA